MPGKSRRIEQRLRVAVAFEFRVHGGKVSRLAREL
jgi:hypothetical protein